MKIGLKKQEKTTEIWFDEKDPTIYICTHNTDVKKRLTAPYSEERRQAASKWAKKKGYLHCKIGRKRKDVCLWRNKEELI